MKIAIFSDTFLPQVNGVAFQVNYLAEMLAEKGNDVCVFTPSSKNYEDKILNFKVVRLISVPALIYKGERLAIPSGKAYRFLEGFKPDIIHTHTPFSVGIEALIAAKLLKVPLVGTHHTFYDHYLKHIHLDFNWARKMTWKMAVAYYNHCDLVLGPSKAFTEEFLKNGIKKPIKVTSYIIDTELFFPAEEGQKEKLKEKFGLKHKSVVCMGRLSYEKSIDVLLEAFAILVKKRPESELMLIGDGPERKNLTELADKLGIKDKVIFTGMLLGKKLSEALQANDIFATASKTETFGVAMLEGMASGLPVVAVAEKAFLELIDDKVNGYLVPADNPDEMADKLATLLEEDGLRKDFSLAARESSLKYSRETVFRKVYYFYEELLKTGSSQLP